MLVSPLDGTNRVPSVFGVNLGSDGQGGIDLAHRRGDPKALEAHVRGSNVTRAKFHQEPRPIRTVVCGALGVAPR